MIHARRPTYASLALALAACSSPTVTDATHRDGATTDAAIPDAAPPGDSPPDATPRDGATTDTTVPDATVPDAPPFDAERPDAPTPDANMPVDGDVPRFVITVRVDSAGAGTIVSEPAGIDCPITCTATLPAGDLLLRATPDAGFAFDHWSGDCAGTTAEVRPTFDRSVSCVATFRPSPASTWIRTHGLGGDHVWNDLALIPADAGAILVGSSAVFGSGGTEAVIARIGGDGALVWQRSYGGPQDDRFTSVARTADGDYIAVGTSGARAVAVRVSSAGQLRWQRYLGQDTEAFRIRAAPGDRYLVTGRAVKDPDWPLWEMLGAVIDGRGRLLRYVQLDPNSDPDLLTLYATAYDGLLLSDGDLLLVGGATRGSRVSSDSQYAMLYRIARNGDLVWSSVISGLSFARLTSIRPTDDGGFVAVGQSSSSGIQDQNTWVVKLSPTGTIEWQRVYGTYRHRSLASQVEVTGDAIWVFGYLAGVRRKNPDNAWIVRLDHSGNVTWQRSFARFSDTGILADTQLAAGRLLAGGGFVAAGMSYTPSRGTYRSAMVLRVPSTGAIDVCAGVVEPVYEMDIVQFVAKTRPSGVSPASLTDEPADLTYQAIAVPAQAMCDGG